MCRKDIELVKSRVCDRIEKASLSLAEYKKKNCCITFSVTVRTTSLRLHRGKSFLCYNIVSNKNIAKGICILIHSHSESIELLLLAIDMS